MVNRLCSKPFKGEFTIILLEMGENISTSAGILSAKTFRIHFIWEIINKHRNTGEYFNKADTIIQLEDYNVYDITNNVRDITKNYISQAKNIVKEKIIMPDFNRKILKIFT